MKSKIIPLSVIILLIVIYLNYKHTVPYNHTIIYKLLQKPLFQTDLKLPSSDYMTDFLNHCSQNQINLSKTDTVYNSYTAQTIDQRQYRLVKIYINECLKQVNKQAHLYFNKINCQPYNFQFIALTECAVYQDKHLNERWIVDIYAQENTSQFTNRFILDITVLFIKPPIEQTKTYMPFGYPTDEQLIPEPMDIINTGSPMFYNKHFNKNKYPYFDKLTDVKTINLNCIHLFNSNLVSGAKQMCPTPNNIPGESHTSLESSLFNSNIKPTLTEQTRLYIDKKINVNKYSLSPNDYNQNKQTNKYHFDTSTNYNSNYSLKSENVNKWDKIWKEPIDIPENQTNPHNFKWDKLGIYNANIKWATNIENKLPYYLPTLTGQPINGGENYWLFDNTAGLTQNTKN